MQYASVGPRGARAHPSALTPPSATGLESSASAKVSVAGFGACSIGVSPALVDAVQKRPFSGGWPTSHSTNYEMYASRAHCRSRARNIDPGVARSRRPAIEWVAPFRPTRWVIVGGGRHRASAERRIGPRLPPRRLRHPRMAHTGRGRTAWPLPYGLLVERVEPLGCVREAPTAHGCDTNDACL